MVNVIGHGILWFLKLRCSDSGALWNTMGLNYRVPCYAMLCHVSSMAKHRVSFHLCVPCIAMERPMAKHRDSIVCHVFLWQNVTAMECHGTLWFSMLFAMAKHGET